MWIIEPLSKLVWLEKVWNNKVCEELFVGHGYDLVVLLIVLVRSSFLYWDFLIATCFTSLHCIICQVLVELVASLEENMGEEKREDLVYVQRQGKVKKNNIIVIKKDFSPNVRNKCNGYIMYT